ncbi:pilin [Comamonas sp.]|uniref:pilin n=1 Tax=Comamonas sp. TaxID=34028 RepID=UPI00289907E3|nr:pilin [Comamonas sp.]
MQQKNETQAGFTLVELMIVVAIVGVLAAIALPSYQAYTIRARVSEALTLMAGAKASIMEYRLSNGIWPVDNATAGLAASSSINGGNISSVVVNGSLITATVRTTMVPGGGVVALQGAVVGDSVYWSCKASAGTTVNPLYLPSECRN